MSASPYLLPDGHVLVAFSGGRTSEKMLRHILDANDPLPRDRVVVSFQNTARERTETLDFIQECESWWGCPVLRLEYRPRGEWPLDGHNAGIDAYISFFGQERYDYMRAWWEENRTPAGYAVVDHASLSRSSEPFEALILSRKYLPNQQQRFCTAELKVRTSSRYLTGELGWDNWTSATGIRKDEPKRWKSEAPRERWTRWMPLVAAGVSRRDVTAFWEAQPFDLRLPNIKGNCWLGNCDGCFLKSEANIAAFTRDFADDAIWWEGMEVVATALTNSSSAAFWSKRYSRAEMRRYIERQGDWALSTDGALCQVADGECAPI